MIAGTRSLILGVLIATNSLAATDCPPSRRAAVSIHLTGGLPGHPAAVEVRGLDAENLLALARVEWDATRWAELLSVSVTTGARKPVAIPGRYRVRGDVLRFEPKFPIEPGLRHRATLAPSRLPNPRADDITAAEFSLAEPPKPAPAFVARVEPSAEVVPENLLKFYLEFSAPMSRGEVYEHVSLVDQDGRKLVSPFLEIGEELWNASGTRLTLLLDPGRIKRGLRPREEDGPILEAGKSYSLRIDRSWTDATGQPLRESFSRSFRAGPADATQPDPRTWTISPPASSTRDALTARFPEPLDRAMLDRALIVRDDGGHAIAGRVEVPPGCREWRFVPTVAWSPGAYRIEIDTELEDLAGNSIARPFEVDVLHPVTSRKETRTVSLNFRVKGGAR